MGEARRYFYARVSSQSQNLDRQIQAFKKLGASDRDIVTDKQSGKDLERQGYQALKNTMLRNGDTLVIKSLDRLSRSKSDIKNELEWFKINKIRLMVIDLPTTMIELPEGQEWVFEMINNILIEVLSSIAEQERLTIRQRQREGVDVAKTKGKHLGRPKAVYPEKWIEVYSEWKRDSKNMTAKKAMYKLNIKRTTFYKLVKDYETNGGAC
jgi:DNA invertase Pin-like site-specific DNA recombinase